MRSMMESFPSLSWRYCDEVGHTRFYIYQLSANGKPPFLSTPISFAVGLVNMIDYGVSGTVGQRGSARILGNDRRPYTDFSGTM